MTSVVFSPDGHTLASGSADTTIRLWNLTDPAHPGPLGQPMTGHTERREQCWRSAPTGTPSPPAAATAPSDCGTYDTAIPLTGHTGTVESVALSPDGHTLASGSRDGSVRLWNLTDTGPPGPAGPAPTGHTEDVTSVAFRPDRHTLASGSRDGSVRLWNLTEPAHPAPLGQPLTGDSGIVTSVAFSPDGQHPGRRQRTIDRAAVESHRPGPPGPAGPALDRPASAPRGVQPRRAHPGRRRRR